MHDIVALGDVLAILGDGLGQVGFHPLASCLSASGENLIRIPAKPVPCISQHLSQDCLVARPRHVSRE
jgi:hypothetical protein